MKKFAISIASIALSAAVAAGETAPTEQVRVTATKEQVAAAVAAERDAARALAMTRAQVFADVSNRVNATPTAVQALSVVSAAEQASNAHAQMAMEQTRRELRRSLRDDVEALRSLSDMAIEMAGSRYEVTRTLAGQD